MYKLKAKVSSLFIDKLYQTFRRGESI